MKIGICTGIDNIAKAASAGYDYIECTVTGINNLDDAAYASALETVKSSPIKVGAFNVLFPGSIRLTGEDYSLDAADGYIARIFPKLKALGGYPVVFGSGGARRVPDGFDMEKAFEQLVEVGKMLGRRALENGLIIAQEPLNKGETNIIHSEADGRRLTDAVDSRGFGLLTDLYHNFFENENFETLVDAGPYVHTHISCAPARTWLNPSEDAQYEMFFGALAKCGYTGYMSYEGKQDDFETEAPKTCVYMRELAKRFGM